MMKRFKLGCDVVMGLEIRRARDPNAVGKRLLSGIMETSFN